MVQMKDLKVQVFFMELKYVDFENWLLEEYKFCKLVECKIKLFQERFDYVYQECFGD